MVLFLLMFAGTRALAQDIEINEENFPDENFRNWLLQQEYGEDGILTTDEIKSVKKMYIEGQNIKSLEGINEFYRLQDLRCDNNQLTSLEIAGLTNLELLTCTNNMLTSLSIRSAPSLVIIECQNNQLTSFIIKGSCPELINVECYQNQLKTSGMDNFLNSLPACNYNGGQLKIIDADNLRQEGNILSMRQRGLVKGGWDVLDSHGNSYIGGYTSEYVTIGSSGYTTWVTKIADTYEKRYHNSDCVEFATVDGITAYIVTAATPAGVKLEAIEKAVPSTPVILKGPEGRHEFTESLTFGGASDFDTKLKAGGAVGDGRTIYKLDSGSQGVGFYLVPSGEEVEHYLVIEQTADDAPEFIPMGTDIEIPEEEVTPAVPPVQIGNLWYDLDSDTKTATVAAVPDGEASYSGTVVIPKTVSSDGDTYRVTAVGDNAFNYCSSLKSVTIGSNVASIGASAFALSMNLKQIICLAATPPECGTNAFYYAGYNNSSAGSGSVSNDINCPLYVPKGSVSKYKAAKRWQDFFTMKSELSVTINSAGYATYCGMTDLDFTGVEDNVTAYVASNYDNGSVTLVPVTNVPAGTGLLLIGTEGTYDIPFVVTDNAYDDNLLVGTLEAQPLPPTTTIDDVDCTNYVLGSKNDEVGFYKSSGTGNIAAYKAYLQLPANAGVSGVRIVIDDDHATGIGMTTRQEVAPQDGAIYNLHGQRVENPQRGLYIVNGKKVVIK